MVALTGKDDVVNSEDKLVLYKYIKLFFLLEFPYEGLATMRLGATDFLSHSFA